MQTITITDVRGNNPTTIPVNPRIAREGACLDLIVRVAVHIGCPVGVRVSIHTDGSAYIWQTMWDGRGSNNYAHIDPAMYGDYPGGQPNAPTEAQRRMVARWWAGGEYPCGLHSGVGKSLADWAFGDMTQAEVEAKYLDGLHIITC